MVLPVAEEPMVTVVIPAFNCQAYIGDALDSVFKQTLPRFEVLVVNDGSTDETAERVLSYSDPRLRLIEHPRNMGQGHALNTALQAVRTPYLCQLDGDDWLEPEALTVLHAHMEKEPDDVALIFANYRIWWHPTLGPRPVEKRRRDASKGKPVAPGSVSARNLRLGWQPLKTNRMLQGFPRYVVHYDRFLRLGGGRAPRFYRITAAKAVGGWRVDDPSKGRFLEDFQMKLRLLKYGYRLRWINATLYNRREHDRNLSRVYANQIKQVRTWVSSGINGHGN